jgi:hypothetical protein
MKKALLVLFICFDLALIGGSVYVLYNYLSHRPARPTHSQPNAVPGTPVAPVTAPAVAVSSGSAVEIAPVIAASTPDGQTTRTKIFSYRNSRAKHVAIRADFTGWKADPMERDAAGVWTYKAVLSPGEYAYCYSVDDKPPLKDPVNKRTKLIGRAVVSAIVVEPFPSQPAK